jgi:hypothetical protein
MLSLFESGLQLNRAPFRKWEEHYGCPLPRVLLVGTAPTRNWKLGLFVMDSQ